MPKPLEDHVYRRIEWNLHNVKELEEAEVAIRREFSRAAARRSITDYREAFQSTLTRRRTKLSL